MGLPSNKALQDLRAGAVGRLVSLEERAAAGDCTREYDARHRDAWHDLLTLTDASTTQNQRSLFSRQTGHSWESKFWRVREIKFAAAFGMEGYDLVRYLWRELPDSRFKRFQEIFSDPDSYAVPRCDLHRPAAIFPDRATLNTCPLRGVLVSPDRIPSKLAQDLGLITWGDPTPKPIPALETKAREGVIQGLKSIWETTAAIDLRNNRIVVIGARGPQDVERYPSAAKLPESILGSIIYIREDLTTRSSRQSSTDTWNAPKKVASYFPTIYHALRKTEYESAHYASEMKGLSALRVDWEVLNSRLRSEWKRLAPTEVKKGLRGEISDLTLRSLRALSHVQSEHKREAEEFLCKVDASLTEGSNNIPAILARTLAAVRRLERRLNVVPQKNAANEIDSSQLRRTVDESVRRFELVSSSLAGAGSVLKREALNRGGHFAVDFSNELDKSASAEKLLARMGVPVTGLEAIQVRPFRIFAKKILEAFAALRYGIINQDLDLAKESFERIGALSKLQALNVAFESLRGYTSSTKAVPLRDVLSIAEALREATEARGTFPLSRAQDCTETLTRLKRVASRITMRLGRYGSQGLDLQERSLMYQRLRAYLDRYDIEQAVQGLR